MEIAANFSPLWALTILAAYLSLSCVHYLNKVEVPKTNQQAYDLKTVHRMFLVSIIIFSAGTINIFLGKYAPPSHFFEFWASYDMIITVLILMVHGMRLFCILMAIVQWIFCATHLMLYMLVYLNLYATGDDILYMNIIFNLNCISCLIFLWGGYDKFRITKRSIFRASGQSYNGWVTNSNIYLVGSRGFVDQKIKQKVSGIRQKGEE